MLFKKLYVVVVVVLALLPLSSAYAEDGERLNSPQEQCREVQISADGSLSLLVATDPRRPHDGFAGFASVVESIRETGTQHHLEYGEGNNLDIYLNAEQLSGRIGLSPNAVRVLVDYLRANFNATDSAICVNGIEFDARILSGGPVDYGIWLFAHNNPVVRFGTPLPQELANDDGR